MKESEAAEIIRLLAAAFHRESIEPETMQLWVEVILPYDAGIATGVALAWVKNADQFPSISQFRHAYFGEKRRSEPELSAAHEVPADWDLGKSSCPLWVLRWLRRAKVIDALPGPRERAAFEDWRVFPEQIVGDAKYPDDPRYTTGEAEELGLMPEDAWC